MRIVAGAFVIGANSAVTASAWIWFRAFTRKISRFLDIAWTWASPKGAWIEQ